MERENRDLLTWGDAAKLSLVVCSPLIATEAISGIKSLVGDFFDDGDIDTTDSIMKLL